MFCIKCGNQVQDGVNFCDKCGTRVSSGFPQDVLHAVKSALEALLGKNQLVQLKQPQAFAAVISAVIIATLLLGWVSIRIRPSSFIPSGDMVDIMDFLPRDARGILQNDIKLTMTIHELNNYARGFKSIDNIDKTNRLQMIPADVSSAIRAAANAISFMRFLQFMCVLSLAAFLFLMTTKNQKAALTGQITTVLIFTFSLIFVISMAAINSQLNRALRSTGLKLSASGWVYITTILGAIGFLLITKCKKIINGEEGV